MFEPYEIVKQIYTHSNENLNSSQLNLRRDENEKIDSVASDSKNGSRNNNQQYQPTLEEIQGFLFYNRKIKNLGGKIL